MKYFIHELFIRELWIICFAVILVDVSSLLVKLGFCMYKISPCFLFGSLFNHFILNELYLISEGFSGLVNKLGILGADISIRTSIFDCLLYPIQAYASLNLCTEGMLSKVISVNPKEIRSLFIFFGPFY